LNVGDGGIAKNLDELDGTAVAIDRVPVCDSRQEL
jgi:hypothetical protein